MATPEEIEQKRAEEKKDEKKNVVTVEEKPLKTKEEPVYQVFMPPLSYDAHAAVQKDNFDPKLILLVRRVRVRPTLIFQGRVEETPAAAQTAAAKSAKPGSPTPTAAAPPQNEDSVVNRVRAFFRRLFS